MNAIANTKPPVPTPNIESTTVDTPSTAAISATTSTGFDLEALRLSPNYSAGLSVKKVLSKIPVGKPDRAKFFRVRSGEEWTYGTLIYVDKAAGETYVVPQFMRPLMGNMTCAAQIYVAIDREDNVFLIAVPLPGEDGRWNSWHESLAQGIEMAKDHWVRLVSNKAINAYEAQQALAALPEPAWPTATMEALLGIAFRGKIIDSPNHAVIRALQGAL